MKTPQSWFRVAYRLWLIPANLLSGNEDKGFRVRLRNFII
jgi:hypothetical protein